MNVASPKKQFESKRRHYKVNASIINDRASQTLAGEEFKRQFLAALDGAVNAISPFIRIYYGRLLGPEWARIRSFIFERDDYTCGYCGLRGGKLECDHIVPVSRGGSDEEDNLVTACFTCNRNKRDKFLSEWCGPCATSK